MVGCIETRKDMTMIDNSKKLDELESKMNILEQTLNEIKDAIREKKKEEETEVSDNTVAKVYDKERQLPDAEQKKIHDIMERFDFEKVHAIMKNLDWKWAFSEDGVPTTVELKNEAHRLLVEACYEETNVSTGGFRAVYEWDDDEPYVGLEFIVEECEGFASPED